MKRIYRLCSLALLFLFSGCQLQDSYSGKMILEGTHTLAAGGYMDGSLILLGGTFAQQPGAVLGGSMHIAGGQAEIGGAINGDITLLNGQLTVQPGAFVHGDLTVLGGTLLLAPEARIDGSLTRSTAAEEENPRPPLAGSTAGSFIHLLFEIPLLALVGYLAARFYPAHLRVLHQAVFRHPLVCAATGLLAMLAGLSLAILMAYTLLLIPASALLIVLMLFAATFGAVPAAVLLGKWALRPFRDRPFFRDRPPTAAGAAVVGMVLLALLGEALRYLPLAGDLLVIALLLTAFGASLLTRFGAQPFVPDTP